MRTEGEVDDDVVRGEVRVDVALVVDEDRSRRSLQSAAVSNKYHYIIYSVDAHDDSDIARSRRH